MNDKMQIGVVIPVRNGAIHLRAAIDSVLAQTLRPTQIIVVDNASTDATESIVAAFADRVEYIRLPERGGSSAARNTGIAEIRTPCLALLNADDLWEPRKLEMQSAALNASGQEAMIFCLMTEFASAELSADEIAALRFNDQPAIGISGCALLIRTKAFHAVGAFDTRLRTGEFIEWYARAKDAGIVTVTVPEVLFRRRLHRNNHGRVERDARADYARAMKIIMDKRRSQA